MPTVAELDVQIDATNNAQAELAALNAMIQGLDATDATVDVDANTRAASTALGAILAELKRISGQTATIDVQAQTANAQAKLARLIAEAAGMQATITADMDTRAAQAEIQRMRALLNSLDANIDIDVDTAAARAQIAALQRALNDVKNTRVGNGGLDQLSLAAERAGSNVRGLIAAGLLLWPALVPLAGAATAAVGGFTTAVGAAGIGTGLFAAVAVTNYNDVTDANKRITQATEEYARATTETARSNALAKIKAQWDQLTPSQAAALTELRSFQSAWQSFAAQFEPQVFGIAAQGLGLIRELLPQVSPMVAGVGTAFERLLVSARAALQGPFWQSFINMLNTQAGPAIETLVRGFGNIIKGFAGILMAFAPFQADWNAGFLRMTESFARWGTELGQSTGFRNFMAYARDAIPRVNAFLGSLVDAIVAVVRAVAPYGDIVLGALTVVFDAITALAQTSPGVLAFSVALIGVGTAALSMLGPIVSILNVGKILAPVMTFLAGAVGLGIAPFIALTAVIAAAGAAIAIAYLQFETFRDVVNGVFGAVLAAGQAFFGWLFTVLGNIAAALLPPIDMLKQFASTIGLIVLGALSMFASALVAILTPIGDFILALSENEGAVRAIAAVIGVLLIPTLARFVTATVIAVATTVAQWAIAAGAATINAVKIAGAWVIAQLGAIAAAVVTVAQIGLMVAGWIGLAAAAALHAARVVGAWLLMNGGAVMAVGTALVAFGTIVAGWVATATAAMVNAARAAAAWILMNGGAMASIAVALAAFASFIAGWVASAAAALFNAALIAGAWLIALGPIGLLIAAIGLVIAIVSAIYVAWNGVPDWFVGLWERVKAPFIAFFGWVGEKMGALAGIFKMEGAKALTEFGAGASSGMPAAMAPINQLPVDAQGRLANGVWMQPQGLGAMTQFGAGGLAGMPTAVAPFGQLPGMVQRDVAPGITNMSISGRDHMQAFGSSSASAQPAAVDPFAGLPPELRAAIGDPAAILGPAGMGTMTGFGAGAAAGLPQAVAPAGMLPGQSQAAVGDTSSLLSPEGVALVGGYATGIESAQQRVTIAMGRVASVIMGAIEASRSYAQREMNALGTDIATATTRMANVVAAGMTQMSSNVTVGMQAMRVGVTTGMTAMQSATTSGMTAVRSTVTTQMTAARVSLTAQMTAMRATTTSSLAAIRATVTAQFTSISTTVTASMTRVRATITTQFAAIRTTATMQMTMIRTMMTTQFTALATLVTAQMTRIRTTITVQMNMVRVVMTAAMTTITAAVRSAMTQIASITAATMSRFAAAVRSGTSSALAAVRAFVSAAISAVSVLRSRFYSAGVAAGSGLASGLRSQVGAVAAASKALAAAAADYMPSSPAKMGPLSGSGWTQIRGQHMAEDLARGMERRKAQVAQQARDLADLMALGASSEYAYDKITGPVVGAGAMASGIAAAGSTINVGGVALEVKVGEGVDPAEARRAFDGAGDDLAAKLADAIRRR